MSADGLQLNDTQTLYRRWEDSQWSPSDYLREHDLLGGFVEGYSLIHHDETRHIGYGVWFRGETVREAPGDG